MLGAFAKGLKGVRMRCKLEDFPEKVQEQVRAKLGLASRAIPVAHDQSKVRQSKQPTKTEADYARLYLAGKGARYESITFVLANGHRYTPDWVWHDGNQLHAVEVKGSYRLGSYQRARMAFDQARIDFPWVRWVWAEKRNDEGWI